MSQREGKERKTQVKYDMKWSLLCGNCVRKIQEDLQREWRKFLHSKVKHGSPLLPLSSQPQHCIDTCAHTVALTNILVYTWSKQDIHLYPFHLLVN